MAKEVISTSILLIATVLAVTAAIMIILPSVKDLSHTYSSVAKGFKERVETDFRIIFISVSNSENVSVNVWMKNTGRSLHLDLIKLSDIFITGSNSIHLTASDERVNLTLENGDEDDLWEYGETLKLKITLNQNEITSGSYELTVVLYNGVKTTEYFSR